MKRMRTNVLAIILSGAVATLAVSDAMAQTQNSRSTYFLEGSTYRHELNAAMSASPVWEISQSAHNPPVV